jgi:hypothetical protein
VPVRIVTLSGSIAAGAAATEIARATVPAGERWTIFEMRVWASAAGATYRIKHRHGASVATVTDQVTDVAVQYKLPYPLDEAAESGDVIALEAVNPTSSAITITVELLYRI